MHKGDILAGLNAPNAALDVTFFCVPVAPDTINNHVKTCREEQKSLHFFAPEYGGAPPLFRLGGGGGGVVSVYPPPL